MKERRAMISLLVSLLILAIVAGIIYWIITLIPLPEPFKNIALVCFMLIVLLVALFKLLPLVGLNLP